MARRRRLVVRVADELLFFVAAWRRRREFGVGLLVNGLHLRYIAVGSASMRAVYSSGWTGQRRTDGAGGRMQGARVYDIPDLALTGLQRAALRKSRRRRLVFGRLRLRVARPDARL